MKRVLITGASGFLGWHCLASLAARGWSDIHAVSRAPGAPGTPSTATWHRGDLIDPAGIAALVREVKASHALHLAWYTMPGQYASSPENLRWLAASATLLEEFARAGGKRFVAAGTCAEYDLSHGTCSETLTPLQPRTPYGVAKHALQTVVSAFGAGLGVSTAWGRLFFPYGPREHPRRLVAYVTRSLLAGIPALCSSGEQRRDFLFAGDVGDAFAVLLESDFNGIVNIGSGEAVAVRSVIDEIGAQLGRMDLIRLGVRPQPSAEPALLVADVARLHREVGWRPRVGLAEGIAASIAYWTRVERRVT